MIVGGGPAGLSAALILGRWRRRVLLCDAGRPRNARSRQANGFFTRDGTDPAELRRLGRAQLGAYGGVELRDVEVTAAARSGDGFEVTLGDGTRHRSRKLLLATGVVDELPEIEGFDVFYGRSIHHCPYCDGWEHRDQPLAIYGRGQAGKGLALELTAWSRDLVLCTDGPADRQREGDVSRTGVILATSKGAVAQVPDKASQKAGVIGFDLERKLRTAEPGPGRGPVRTFVVNLTGSMSPYVWTLNGQRYGEGEPLRVRRGEWVEIDMRNQTAMSHPMHLHGHHFQVLAINGERFDGALRDTVLVPAQARVTIGFQADNPGRWAFHCHNLYHLVAGMMTEVRYDA